MGASLLNWLESSGRVVAAESLVLFIQGKDLPRAFIAESEKSLETLKHFVHCGLNNPIEWKISLMSCMVSVSDVRVKN